MTEASKITSRRLSTSRLCIGDLVMAGVGASWFFAGAGEFEKGADRPTLFGPPLFGLGVAICLVTLSGCTPNWSAFSCSQAPVWSSQVLAFCSRCRLA